MSQPPPAPRPPRLSHTSMTELVLPQHSNAIGTAFGGAVLSWIDVCGAIAARRHCGHVAVTAALDEMVFLAPIRLGDVVVLSARVNASFRTSMEVEVTVEREDRDRTRTLCADAVLTFVCRGDDGAALAVAPLACETEDERAREAAARVRRAARLARKPR